MLGAQTGKIYTTDMGLSSSLINQIFQDKQGFVWVATEYGLNKFDGLRFTNYRHVSADSSSIKIIMCVHYLRIVVVIC